MINKEEMLSLVRSVGVHDDVEQGMNHAFDLGVDWAIAEVTKIALLEVDPPQCHNLLQHIRGIKP